MGKCQPEVESDEVDWRYMAECGYEHRLTVRFHHVVHVPFKLSRTSTSFKFSQASTSSSVLTTLDICQHDAKSFVSITESQKLWIRFFLIMTHSTKKGIILCDFSSWVNQTSTMRAWWLKILCLWYCVWIVEGSAVITHPLMSNSVSGLRRPRRPIRQCLLVNVVGLDAEVDAWDSLNTHRFDVWCFCESSRTFDPAVGLCLSRFDVELPPPELRQVALFPHVLPRTVLEKVSCFDTPRTAWYKRGRLGGISSTSLPFLVNQSFLVQKQITNLLSENWTKGKLKQYKLAFSSCYRQPNQATGHTSWEIWKMVKFLYIVWDEWSLSSNIQNQINTRFQGHNCHQHTHTHTHTPPPTHTHAHPPPPPPPHTHNIQSNIL